MTTNPFAGVPNSSPTTFDPRIVYKFNIDQNGDAVADVVIGLEFGRPNRRGIQNLRLRARGLPLRAAGRTGRDIRVVAALPPLAGPVGTLRAALQDDPFFFDAVAFSDLVGDGIPFNAPNVNQRFDRNPGQNLFGPIDIDGNPGPDTPGQGPNVLAITLEIPSALLGPDGATIGCWGSTEMDGNQLDRMGFPAINTALVAPVPRTDPGNNFPTLATGPANNRQNEFNQAMPAQDPSLFLQDTTNIIRDFYRAVVGDPMGQGVVPPPTLAGILLPDILPFQLGNGNGFPSLNGRQLADDVIDVELGLLTGGVFTSDNTSNDSTFQDEFPYIGPPNPIPQGRNLN
jgi:hypothetical protein